MHSPSSSTWRPSPAPRPRRRRRESALGGWVVAAIFTSVGVHLLLWQVFQTIHLPDYFAEAPAEEAIPIDLRRARINEEAAVQPTPPPQVIEREAPMVQEPVDITEIAKALPPAELTLSPEAQVPQNITLSPMPSAGSPEASTSSLLTAVPMRVDAASLSDQLGSLPDRLTSDPRLSELQVNIPISEEGALDNGSLQDTLGAALQQGNQGVGDADGFASLDDLLAYKGPVTEDKKAMMPTDLLFEYNSAELKDSARLSLMKLGFIIQRNPDADITLEGHTDTHGSEAYNLQLSEARALAVKNWLVESLRLDGSRLRTVGVGEARPLVPTGTPEQQAKNRRVEIVIKPR